MSSKACLGSDEKLRCLGVCLDLNNSLGLFSILYLKYKC